MTTFETIVVERPEPRIARIVMNRPEARNAQNLQMTYDLNAAFDQAVQDDAIKVIVLSANGLGLLALGILGGPLMAWCLEAVTR